MSKRFDGQPYTEEYLRRSPKNRCLNCGDFLKISPGGKWNSIIYGEKIIGYCHLKCSEDFESFEEIK